MNKKNDAVGYVRVSTLQQAENGTSVEDQKRIIEKKAKYDELNLTKIYSDEGVSGKSTHRPAFERMLNDAKRGKFKLILFTKLDRLARNLRDTLNIYNETKELGIDMICIDNPVISTNGPMGTVMLSILGTFAQFERELIRSRTYAGRMNKWKSGESIMGHLPFGYIKNAETKKIEIDNYKKDIIHHIFELYTVERLPMLDIAKRLTTEGYKTPSSLNGRKDASQEWNMHTVRGILKNRCYTGEPVSFNKNKFICNEDNNIRKALEEKPQEEWINLTFPKIIEEQQFTEVQQRITYNKVIPKKTAKDNPEKFLTLHLLRCGICRAKLAKQTTVSQKTSYYVCQWRRSNEKKLEAAHRKRCGLPFLHYEAIDNQVFDKVINLISNPNEFLEIYAMTSQPKNLKVQLDGLLLERDDLKSKLTNMLNVETNTNDPDLLKLYKSSRTKTEEKFTHVNNMISKITGELSFYNNRNEQIEKFQKLFPLKKMKDVRKARNKIKQLLTDLPFNEKKKLLDAVISPETGGCIYVGPLAEHHLAPTDFITSDDTNEAAADTAAAHAVATEAAKNDTKDLSKEKDATEKSMVLELDFTLDPFKISQIIQGLYNSGFKIDKR